MKCSNCVHFTRSIYETGEPQTLGTCALLYKVLLMDNAPMWFMKTIQVQDSFGCSLFREI